MSTYNTVSLLLFNVSMLYAYHMQESYFTYAMVEVPFLCKPSFVVVYIQQQKIGK